MLRVRAQVIASVGLDRSVAAAGGVIEFIIMKWDGCRTGCGGEGRSVRCQRKRSHRHAVQWKVGRLVVVVVDGGGDYVR